MEGCSYRENSAWNSDCYAWHCCLTGSLCSYCAFASFWKHFAEVAVVVVVAAAVVVVVADVVVVVVDGLALHLRLMDCYVDVYSCYLN